MSGMGIQVPARSSSQEHFSAFLSSDKRGEAGPVFTGFNRLRVADRAADLLGQFLLGQAAPVSDQRDQIGLERKGRLLARDIAQQVAAEARHA